MRYFFDVFVPASNSGIFTTAWPSRAEAQKANDNHSPARVRYVAELEITRVDGGYSVIDMDAATAFTLYAENGSMAYEAGRIITPDDEPYYSALARLDQAIADRATANRISRKHHAAALAETTAWKYQTEQLRD